MILSLMVSTIMAASPVASNHLEKRPVLAEVDLLKSVHIEISETNKTSEIGLAYVDEIQARALTRANHLLGRCGGFEDLKAGQEGNKALFNPMAEMAKLDQALDKESQQKFLLKSQGIVFSENVAKAIEEVNPQNLRETVEFLSSFPDRYNRSANPDKHIAPMKQRLQKILDNYPHPYEVLSISHSSTGQTSIGVRLVGKTKPEEIVVLGGHLDSINGNYFQTIAPGADDNASGSANLKEALRVIVEQGQPQRTVEFFWYAGEESGLLGAAEIAKDYQAKNKDVVSVMQIDMSLVPGNGSMVMGSIGDYTSQWLRDLMLQLNDLYLHNEVVEFNCGYGCSDHAAWFRQGFSTFAPFEATMNTINRKIHTKNDVIGPESDFQHSAEFSKLAIAYVMHMANSDIRGF